MDLVRLRLSIAEGRLLWSAHALKRMAERGISTKQVVDTLLDAIIIEDYPQSRPWPAALFLGRSDETPVHVVAALSPREDTIAVITVYNPDSDRFEDDFRTRKP
jgi:uncharacterized DUF497 family protein